MNKITRGWGMSREHIKSFEKAISNFNTNALETEPCYCVSGHDELCPRCRLLKERKENLHLKPRELHRGMLAYLKQFKHATQ